ncbi:MAG: phosphorylase [Saprospirales bacterium]|nr:MAG: phosphorylase [Saprospirales bacterium]
MEKWDTANLIINDAGRIYHLDLCGDDIANTIILVGDPQRVEVVSSFFDTIDIKREKREFITHTGTLRGKPVSVMSTGISTSNIDIAINELDAVANIDLDKREIREKFRQLTFVRLGTSGSIDPEADVDTVVVSEYALGFDALMFMYQKAENQEPFFIELEKAIRFHFHLRGLSYPVYLTQAHPELIKKFGPHYKMGITTTMHGFYGPQGRELRLAGRYPKLIDILQSFEYKGKRFANIEMESSAIFGLSDLLGHRAISFNCIIANRTAGRFSKDPYKSVRKMVGEVLDELI